MEAAVAQTVSEFGGIACSDDALKTWGYSRAGSSEELARRYTELLRAVRTIPVLKGCSVRLNGDGVSGGLAWLT